MVITLYKNISDARVVDKVLTEPINKDVTRKDSWSIETPSFTVTIGENEGYLLGYNYCYIPAFKRYYMARITLANGGLAVISCDVDPLMSFKQGIRGLTAMIDRQEYVNNPYINDGMLPIAQGSVIDTIDVGQVGNSTSTFYLTCVGGIEN